MEKFAKVCSVTGEGMNEGYVFEDGEMYFKYEKDFIAFLRQREGNNDLSDEFLLNEAYELEEFYYTSWTNESNYWYEVFTTNDLGETQTIQTFDTQIEAQQYVSNNPDQNLQIDKWKLNEQGINEKVSF